MRIFFRNFETLSMQSWKFVDFDPIYDTYARLKMFSDVVWLCHKANCFDELIRWYILSKFKIRTYICDANRPLLDSHRRHRFNLLVRYITCFGAQEKNMRTEKKEKKQLIARAESENKENMRKKAAHIAEQHTGLLAKETHHWVNWKEQQQQ